MTRNILWKRSISNKLTSTVLVVLTFCFICCNSLHESKNGGSVSLRIDSIFINQYKKNVDISGVPYIFYQCSIINETDSDLNIDMRRFDFQDRTRNQAFLIFGHDSVELFFGRFTPNKIQVRAKSTFAFDLNPEPIPLFEMKAGHAYDSLGGNEYLFRIAQKSSIVLYWPPYVIHADPALRKISFRSTADKKAFKNGSNNLQLSVQGSNQARPEKELKAI